MLLALLLLARVHHSSSLPDLSGDIVTSEYLLMTRPPPAALFDCDVWDDTLHVTLQLMSARPQACHWHAKHLCLQCAQHPSLSPLLPSLPRVRNPAEALGFGYRCDIEVDGAVVR